MSDRLRYIKPATKASPSTVAAAIERITNMLDLADDGKEVVFYAGKIGPDSCEAWCIAWSQAALLIADAGDVPSTTLRKLAHSIYKGNQLAMFE